MEISWLEINNSNRRRVHSIWSDNGTNFMGARNELQQGFKEMKHNKIKNSSYKKMVQIGFCHDTNNPPGASHVGDMGMPNPICSNNYFERNVEDTQSLLE